MISYEPTSKPFFFLDHMTHQQSPLRHKKQKLPKWGQGHSREACARPLKSSRNWYSFCSHGRSEFQSISNTSHSQSPVLAIQCSANKKQYLPSEVRSTPIITWALKQFEAACRWTRTLPSLGSIAMHQRHHSRPACTKWHVHHQVPAWSKAAAASRASLHTHAWMKVFKAHHASIQPCMFTKSAKTWWGVDLKPWHPLASSSWGTCRFKFGGM